MKIVEAKPLSGFKVFLRFEDGTSGDVDLSSYAGRGVFLAWMEPGIFGQVKVTSTGAVEWPGDLDLCPDALYLRLTGKSPEELFPALQLTNAGDFPLLRDSDSDLLWGSLPASFSCELCWADGQI
jgi:hypothetical protein